MNGSEIFMFTQKNVPIVVQQTLAQTTLTLDDLDLVVFHQANSYMLNFLRKKIKVPQEKFFVNMEMIGNTVSNSIPIALYDSQKQAEGYSSQRNGEERCRDYYRSDRYG